MYEPIAADLAVRNTRSLALSARPDAPVVPDLPRARRNHGRTVAPLRAGAARSLRLVAAWVEPKRGTQPVC